MVERLADVERRLESSNSTGFMAGAEAELSPEELCASFAAGATWPGALAALFGAFPRSSALLVEALAAEQGGFWPALGRRFFAGSAFERSDFGAARVALGRALARLGVARAGPARLLAASNGVTGFSLVEASAGSSLRVQLEWFGPPPRALVLRLDALDRPALPAIERTLELARASLTAELTLEQSLPLGVYEASLWCAETGQVALLADGGTAYAELHCSQALEASESPAEAELVAWARTRDSAGLARVLAQSGGVELVLAAFDARRGAFVEARSAALGRALGAALLAGDRQAALLDWARGQPERGARLAGAGLVSFALPPEAFEELTEAELGGGVTAALIAVHAGPEERAARLGDIGVAWSDAPDSDAVERLVEHRGRRYRLVVEEREGERSLGMLTAACEEEVEVVVEARGEGLVMYPELSQRRLLLCSCGVLVSALAEPHGHPGGSARSGAPVTKARAIEVAFVAPRCRPQASRLLAGVAEGRRLALAATRGAVANARDRAAITEAQGVPGPALEPLGYVRAMLAWALPLASEPTETKSRLWEIDRDCKGFDALTRSWGREALETLDADRRALFETYIEHHRPRRGTSAPLAIEKAVLGFAARMRLLARLSGLVSAEAWVAQGLLEARVRALCPELLGWYCAICELILSDGGGAGMATSAATAGSMTKK